MKISVVIPTYNYARYIVYAIDSVLAQTRQPDEIIVVDDGSTDNTREVLAPYLSRIRYIHQSNAGLSAARNTGTSAASGDWVAYLDSDDGWMPDKLLKQEAAILNTANPVVAYTGAILLEPDGGVTDARTPPGPDRLWPMLRHHNVIPASSSMAHRQSVLDSGGFNEKLRACEDWDLWTRLKRKGNFAAATEPLTIVRQTPQSMSSNVERMIDNMEAIREGSLLHGLTGISRYLWTRRIRAMAQFHAALVVGPASRALEQKHLLRSLAYWPSPWFEPRRYLALIRNLVGLSAYKRMTAMLRTGTQRS